MIINNFEHPFREINIPLFDAGSDENPPIMDDLLKTMAQNYFPEFSHDSGEKPPAREETFNILPEILSPFSVPPIYPYETFFNSKAIRKDFPILSEKLNGKNLIWFDNAATTQKPRKVIERLKYYYEHENSNVHRAAHTLAARTTDAYEDARSKIASFLNANSPDEIVFVRGTTEAINLVSQSYGMPNLSEGDEVIVSLLEHHANIVPWQIICQDTGAKLKTIPVDDSGQLILEEYEKLLNARTKIVAFTHVSNALGTITPVEEMIKMAHRYGAKVLVDGAQAVAHLKVNVQELDCDFYAFSGHKLFGPTGIGVLYGKRDLLESMQPYQSGGNMIANVTFEQTTYQSPPHRFEAGTGSIADAIGLGSAVDYVTSIGLDTISHYEHELLEYARKSVQQVPGLSLLGNAPQRASILSFIIKGFDMAKIGKVLSNEGIAIRTGHHCSQPILRRYGLEGPARASFAFYNTYEEIDFFISVLYKIVNGHILNF
jgi:cysteine desulfurase/selenocysteine lyase